MKKTQEYEFDRELTFREAVLNDEASSYLDHVMTLAELPCTLVGPSGENGCSYRLSPGQDLIFLIREKGLPIEPTCYRGRNGSDCWGFPVKHEGETFGVLLVEQILDSDTKPPYQKINSMIALIEKFLDLKHQQIMISEVHDSSLELSYQELLEKNKALEVSEKRYRDLCATLEVRVEERKKELEQAQQQLLQQEKMASIGQLAAGVAHEINNPTGFIQSNLSTLQKYSENLSAMLNEFRAQGHTGKCKQKWQELDIDYILEDLPLLIDQSLKGTSRIVKIVQSLSRFSHVDKNEVESVDINELLESVIELLWNEIKHKANLKKEFQPLPRIDCFANQLSQVFVNIMVNSIQALDQFGEIAVRTRAENDRIEVEIQDDGHGIEKENLVKVFDPFFTTKPVGKGTGLGLSISYEIVKSHGGEIRVKSERMKGTTFQVSMPIARENERIVK
jgi:two-component system NtrC family sensor kinase